MRPEEYYQFARAMCERAVSLSTRKNADYADPEAKQSDPFAVFANFTACERLGICTTEQGFLVRILDKIVRVSNLLRPGHEQKVMDEAVQDTLDDLHNYAELLSGFLECVKRHGRPVQMVEGGPEPVPEGLFPASPAADVREHADPVAIHIGCGPRKGDIAMCALGRVGLILSDRPVEVTREDGAKRMAWTGVHVWPRSWIGKPWSSRNPKVIGDVVDPGEVRKVVGG